MGHRRSIAGLRILVTGASQGIGRALALVAAEQAAQVLATARNDHCCENWHPKARTPRVHSKRWSPTSSPPRIGKG